MATLDLLENQALSFAETSLAMEEVDLHSADEATCIRYRLLRRLYVQQAHNLIATIEQAAPRLREQLAGILRDC